MCLQLSKKKFMCHSTIEYFKVVTKDAKNLAGIFILCYIYIACFLYNTFYSVIRKQLGITFYMEWEHKRLGIYFYTQVSK